VNEKTLEERVETVENDLEALRGLPVEVKVLATRVAGVESQIVQLRTEMTDGFSAIRGAMGTMKVELRAEMTTMKTELREDIAALGRETAAGFVQAGTEMRLLFEEHVGRRAVISEGNPPPDAQSGT